MSRHRDSGNKRQRNKTNLWISFLAFVALLTPLATKAGTYGDLTYTSDGSAITITDCSLTATNVAIPDTIEGLPVTSIGYSAFYTCTSLTNVIISTNVTRIDDFGFYSCSNLTSISSIENVTNLGYNAFRYCTSLPDIVLGNGLAKINFAAFSSCTSLGNITIPDSVAYISPRAFYSCTSLTNVFIGSGVTNIEWEAFRLCNSLPEITVDPANAYYSSQDGVLFNKDQTDLVQCPDGKPGSYVIPGTVTNIGISAFNNTSLTNVTIPASVASIEAWAFEWSTNISDINVDAANLYFSSTNGILYNKDQTTIIQYPGGKANETYSIPDGVVGIGGGAFSFSYNLSEVAIPNTVTNIGPAAFRDCTGLTEIIIPNNVTSVEFACCYNCTSLSNVILGTNVTSIGGGYAGAFESCTSLTSITIPENITSITSDAFKGCTNLTEVVIRVPNVDELTFEYLTDVVFDDTVTNIGDYALQNHFSLTNIVLGTNVTHIGTRAFYNCTSLSSVSIPDSVVSLGNAVFLNCSSLTNIEIPESVTSIGGHVFRDCTLLTNIIFPNSLSTIGNYACRGCTSLYSVYFTGDAPVAGTSIFLDANNATIYYLPDTSGWGATYGGRPTVLWNPVMQLGTGYGATTNGFSFNVSGTVNIPIAVETCTNLEGGIWIPLQTTNLSGGSLDFTDADWTNYPSRIYRIAAP